MLHANSDIQKTRQTFFFNITLYFLLFRNVPNYDIAVVGGGIVGMATAREIAIRYPNMKLAVIEKENDICKLILIFVQVVKLFPKYIVFIYYRFFFPRVHMWLFPFQ